ncbi:beta-lactamase family protein [Hymenobacter sp. BT683]|uniref:Beta-lactamase family protein n=1 Tax=Hymenobacter jeongseonensis TaxID=2791027 RepID=A0ABS0II64_9BACT|nr:serine hydrolase domain-containing protein [Hymenobacter jeongseonensis]MBF9238031.1 beta-lactamase family protein [Hymenobacter jeongseonensis]
MRLSPFLLLFGLGLARPAVAQQPVPQRLAAYMQGQHDINRFAGVVLVTRHDTVLLQQAYGLADAEWAVPNTLETRFALASITKHITALAILQLAERGRLQLTDKLNSFLPGFPNGDAISVHQLLTHTAGLALDFEELYLDHTAVSKDSALAFMKRQPVQFAPGTRVGYSNVGYFLLGQIIEKASGLSYGAYLQRHIFDVAGMSQTGLNSTTALVPRLARLYYREGDALVKNPYINWDLNVGHDGLYSTAGDLAKLDRALRGTALLSEASKALMATPHNQRFPGNGFLDRYGYGVFISPYYNQGHYLLTHSGGYFGAMTTLDRYPQDGIFVTVLSNNQAEAHWIGYGLAGILFGKAVEVPYVHRALPAAPAGLPAFAGQYGATRILHANGQLYLQDLETPLVTEAPRKFFSRKNPDRTVEFLLTKSGRVHALTLTKGGVKETLPRQSTAARR